MNYLNIVRIIIAAIKSLVGGTLGAVLFPGYKMMTLAYMLIENSGYGSLSEAFYNTRYILLLLLSDVAWYGGAFVIRMLREGGARAPSSSPITNNLRCLIHCSKTHTICLSILSEDPSVFAK